MSQLNLSLNQKGLAPIILILLAFLGVIIYLLLSSSAPFKDKLLNLLYPKPSSKAEEVQSIPDEVLVKFKAGVDERVKENIRTAHGLDKINEVKQIGVELIKVPDQIKDKIIEVLNKNPGVEYAEVNSIALPNDIPNDPGFADQWNLAKIAAASAWDYQKGSSGVIVGIIDSGVKFDHEDLVDNLVAGHNFYDNNLDTSDINGHGTVVSGVAGAVTNNSKGIASLGRDISIAPLKVFLPDGRGGSIFAIADALAYAGDSGIKVVNISLGTCCSGQTLENAVNYAFGRGVLITASSGNSNVSAVEYPAAYDNVVAVGATNGDDSRANFSNYGSGLDLVAPGVGIYSTNKESGYDRYFGTSFAAPHVAALAALIFSAKIELTNQQVIDIIKTTALDLGDPGWDQYFGWGRIQADKALQKVIDTNPIPTPTPTSLPTPIPTPAPDTTPPSVAISSPSSGAAVSGVINIAASASDQGGIVSISIFVDDSITTSCTSSSCSYLWDTNLVSNGTHTILAKALDNSNNLGQSEVVTISVNNPAATATPKPIQPDTIPPSVSLVYPSNGSILSRNSQINIQAEAFDNVRVAKVEFLVNNSIKCSDASLPYSCSWKVPGKKNTSYSISAKAYDVSNNQSSANISVQVP